MKIHMRCKFIVVAMHFPFCIYIYIYICIYVYMHWKYTWWFISCVCVCVCVCVCAGVATEPCRRHMRHGSMWRLLGIWCWPPVGRRCRYRGSVCGFRRRPSRRPALDHGSQWLRRWGNKLSMPCRLAVIPPQGRLPRTGAWCDRPFRRDGAFGAPVIEDPFRDPRACVCVLLLLLMYYHKTSCAHCAHEWKDVLGTVRALTIIRLVSCFLFKSVSVFLVFRLLLAMLGGEAPHVRRTRLKRERLERDAASSGARPAVSLRSGKSKLARLLLHMWSWLHTPSFKYVVKWQHWQLYVYVSAQ